MHNKFIGFLGVIVSFLKKGKGSRAYWFDLLCTTCAPLLGRVGFMSKIKQAMSAYERVLGSTLSLFSMDAFFALDLINNRGIYYNSDKQLSNAKTPLFKEENHARVR